MKGLCDHGVLIHAYVELVTVDQYVGVPAVQQLRQSNDGLLVKRDILSIAHEFESFATVGRESVACGVTVSLNVVEQGGDLYSGWCVGGFWFRGLTGGSRVTLRDIVETARNIREDGGRYKCIVIM